MAAHDTVEHHYIPVNGIRLFYEKSGQGNPIILLHGNGESHAIFDILTGKLAERYTVYAVDSRDHGKSSKVNSISYDIMMEDIAELIISLELKNPILYGFSDGGIIGLLMAVKYPDMLSKLIVSGPNINTKGIRRFYYYMMKLGFFFTRNRKLRLMLTEPDIKPAELKKIITPTHILAGSKEFATIKHIRMIAENIPDSTLRILEKETHDSYVVHSEKLYEVMEMYLSQETLDEVIYQRNKNSGKQIPDLDFRNLQQIQSNPHNQNRADQ